jgi:hypothetical protein
MPVTIANADQQAVSLADEVSEALLLALSVRFLRIQLTVNLHNGL